MGRSIEGILANEAIGMLKAGQGEAAVVSRLVSLGADDADARAYVARLVAMKRQADAMNPNKLRADAVAMLQGGASDADVVDHFVKLGIDEAASRAEVATIAAYVAEQNAAGVRLEPCQRCGRVAPAGDLFFDAHGRRVCRACNSADAIGAADARAFQSEQEGAMAMRAFAGMAGVPAAATRHMFRPEAREVTCACGNVFSLEGLPAAGGRYACPKCGTAIG